MEAVCAAKPEDGLPLFYRGEALNRLGRVEEAIEALERVTELIPRQPQSLLHPGGPLRQKEPSRESRRHVSESPGADGSMIRVILSAASGLWGRGHPPVRLGESGTRHPLQPGVGVWRGPVSRRRLQAMGDLPVGAAVITPGGELPAAFLIHVVLQSAEEPVTAEGLRSALKNGLRRAEEWGLEILALPPLGTGAGNMDAEEAAALMVPVLSRHLHSGEYPEKSSSWPGTGYEEDVFVRA